MKKKRAIFCAVLIFFVFVGSYEEATASTYTDRTAWETAASGIGPITTEDFEGIPIQSFPSGTTSNLGVIPFDITLTGTPISSGIALIDGDQVMELFISSDTVSQAEMTFQTPIRGFAADWFSTTTGNDLVVITVGGNQYLFGEYLGYGQGDGFFGVIEDTSFTTITFTVEELTLFGEYFWTDDFSVAVPEPATLGLLLLGGLALFRYRRSA